MLLKMNPYDMLYIYEINGRVTEEKSAFPSVYIGNWWEGDHSFLFFSQEQGDFVRSILDKDPFLSLVDRFTMPYRDWQAGDEIEPFRVGPLVFIPCWKKVKPEADEQPILLDPSVVFGTGLHPTTRTCLETLWRIYQNHRPRVVLDLGAGTGILALAAAKLGAERVVAVDLNPLAVDTAKRNVELNGEERRIEVVEGEAQAFISEAADLACCNLPFQVIEELLGGTGFLHRGWMIFSGFFKSQGERIAKALRDRGTAVEIIPTEPPWVTILGHHASTGAHDEGDR
jgi:ribosomal protein L11 methyltransferase